MNNLCKFWGEEENLVNSIETKVCSKCGIEKSLLDFYQDNSATSGFGNRRDINGVLKNPDKRYVRYDCKTCHDKMNKGKNMAYKLAGKPSPPPLGTPCEKCGITTRKLHFDHDHEDLSFRGWICQPCNTGIGKLGDDIEGVTEALDYLLKAQQKQ